MRKKSGKGAKIRHSSDLPTNRTGQLVCCTSNNRPIAMLITNKHKTSKKGDGKADASRRIRKSEFDHPLKPPSRRKQHDQAACPICLARIPKIASGGRRSHSCSQCGATLNKLLLCKRCGAERIWQGKQGAACAGCGTKYDAG